MGDSATLFFKRFNAMLDVRGLTLDGVTTDGWPWYPEPLAEVFGEIQHQQRRFHVFNGLNKVSSRQSHKFESN